LFIEIYCRCVRSPCSRKAVCSVCLNTRGYYVIIEESSCVSHAPNSLKEARRLNIYRLRKKHFARSISLYSNHSYYVPLSAQFCTNLSYVITNHLYVPSVILTKCSNILVQHYSESTYEGWNFNSGKYLFTTDLTIQDWNQLPAEVLGTLPCKLKTLKKRVRKATIEVI